jgi:hypothetical protein
MPRRSFVLSACLLVLLVLAGCEGGRDPAPSMAESPDAEAVTRAIETDLRAMANLPYNRRSVAEMAFGQRLRSDLEVCRGTRYENKPLYLLAQWTLVHGGEAGPTEVLRLVDRLEILPAPAFRKAGQALRVFALLRLGRLAEAKRIAVQLEGEVPEFGALRRVEFYEQIGLPAPPLPGTTVTGGGESSADGFVLVAFLGMPDAAAEAWLKPLKDAAGATVRTVAVATGGDLLAAATVASAWGVEVRWLRQGDPALAQWRVPVLPMSVLLGPGPQRIIVAVDVRPGQLTALAPKSH